MEPWQREQRRRRWRRNVGRVGVAAVVLWAGFWVPAVEGELRTRGGAASPEASAVEGYTVFLADASGTRWGTTDQTGRFHLSGRLSPLAVLVRLSEPIAHVVGPFGQVVVHLPHQGRYEIDVSDEPGLQLYKSGTARYRRREHQLYCYRMSPAACEHLEELRRYGQCRLMRHRSEPCGPVPVPAR